MTEKRLQFSTKNYIRSWFRKTTFDQALLTLLAASLPFERIPSFDLGGVTIRISVILGGLIILRAIYLHARSIRSLRFSLSETLLLLFSAWIIILIPFALNHTRAVEVVIFDLFIIALALSIKLLYRAEYLLGITRAILYSAIAVCTFGLYQYFGNILGLGSNLTGLRERYSWEVFGFPRIQGASLEPLYFASYLTLPIAVSIALVLTRGWRKLYVFALSLASLNLFLTVSRGGTVALILLLVLVILFSLYKRTVIKGLLVVGLVAISYAVALLMIAYLNKPITFGPSHEKTSISTYKKQISDIGLQGAGDERAQSRNAALRIAKDHLIFGIGPGNFGPVLQNNKKSAAGWTIVNNETLELLAETGIIGLGLIISAFSILVFAGVGYVKREAPSLASTWVLALVGYLLIMAVQYQTFSTLYITHIWFAVGILLAILYAQRHSVKKQIA